MTITPTLNYSGETVPVRTYEYSDDDSLGYFSDSDSERSALVADFVSAQQEQEADQEVQEMTLEEELEWTKHNFDELKSSFCEKNQWVVLANYKIESAEDAETGSD
ncbi:hypothetical protein MP638_006038 [Amoeboaphelidium occidentale]|nr:hypothetical protein MP638_006038 [Amoeboaphelidium occidentale]